MDAIVFEVSTEAAHKVGGIYAVLASKAPQMRKSFKAYYAIGPYDPKSAAVDFEQSTEHPFHPVFQQLGQIGIKCVFGKWINAGKANCILVDPSGIRGQLNEIKTKLWGEYRVDSLFSSDFFNDCIVWGEAVGILLEKVLAMDRFKNEKVICQFHEWLAGSALLHLKSVNSKAGLVFTTHATTMGRTMAERGEDLVGEVQAGLKKRIAIDVSRAKQYNVQAIHTLEKACAENADAFTTVSEVVGEEATFILGKKPDVLTLNGLSIDIYPSMEELSISHKQSWTRIKHFVLGYFSPYYAVDMSNTLFFFTAGRYEMHNKGFDFLIKSLAALNNRLKAEKSKKTAIVFLFVPARAKDHNPEVLDNLSLFEALEDEVIESLDEIREHIIESVCSGKLPTKGAVFDEPFLYDLKQMMARMKIKNGEKAPMATMTLDDSNDGILKMLSENGLDNAEDDRIKVVFYPSYLSSADGLIGLNYNEVIMGCHLGIFPSYYEPYGYTPLETAALAVPAVTTDLAGFGKFIKPHAHGERSAISVIERKEKGDDGALKQLVGYMHFILNTTKKERVAKKIEAKKLSELADWQKLIKNYILAYELSIRKAQERQK